MDTAARLEALGRFEEAEDDHVERRQDEGYRRIEAGPDEDRFKGQDERNRQIKDRPPEAFLDSPGHEEAHDAEEDDRDDGRRQVEAVHAGNAVPGGRYAGNKERARSGAAAEPAERRAPGLADVDGIADEHDGHGQAAEHQEGDIIRRLRGQTESGEDRNRRSPGKDG